MLTKIDLVRNVGRFAELRQKAEGLRQLALIYARNAYGKSTLCAVLRSAASGDLTLLSERKRLGATDNSSISTTWADGDVSFNGAAWNRKPIRTVIYDAEFVRQNIHVADDITRDNKRSLLRVIVGAEGVRLAQQINEADVAIDGLNKALAEKDRAIRLLHPTVNDIDALSTQAIPADLDRQLSSAKRRAASVKLGGQIAVRVAPEPVSLTFEKLDSVIESLPDTVEGVSGSLEDVINEHIREHSLEPQGRRWLRYGVDRLNGETCPFCAQDLQGSQFAKVLRAYFSERLKSLAEASDLVAAELGALLGSGSDAEPLRTALARNGELLAQWREIVELPSQPSLAVEDVDDLIVGLKQLRVAVERKRRMLLEPVVLSAGVAARFSELVSTLRTYNDELSACLAAIQEAKRNPPTSTPPAIDREVGMLEALAARRDGNLKQLVAERTALAATKLERVAQKEADKLALKGSLEATSSNHEKAINDLLELFGANFSLCHTKASYVGRDPNTDYSLNVDGQVLKVGPSAKGGPPSFKTVLSAGDKATLALAFFIARVMSDPKRADTVVVFDDPFSSQDHFRRIETARQIRLVAAEARQAVVFSHDLRFLEEVWREADNDIRSCHQVLFEGPGSAALRWCDVEDELKVLYVRRADRIRLYAKTGLPPRDCTLNELQADLRTFLEEYVDLRNPGRWPRLTALGGMIEEVTNAGPSDPLFASVATLRAINEYSRPDHHRGAPSVDPDQLRAKCRQVVSIIGF